MYIWKWDIGSVRVLASIAGT